MTVFVSAAGPPERAGTRTAGLIPVGASLSHPPRAPFWAAVIGAMRVCSGSLPLRPLTFVAAAVRLPAIWVCSRSFQPLAPAAAAAPAPAADRAARRAPVGAADRSLTRRS